MWTCAGQSLPDIEIVLQQRFPFSSHKCDAEDRDPSGLHPMIDAQPLPTSDFQTFLALVNEQQLDRFSMESIHHDELALLYSEGSEKGEKTPTRKGVRAQGPPSHFQVECTLLELALPPQDLSTSCHPI